MLHIAVANAQLEMSFYFTELTEHYEDTVVNHTAYGLIGNV